MNNSFINFIGLLAIMTATSLIIVTSQEYSDKTLNDTAMNNTTLSNTSLNLSAMNYTAINATNETAFMIGDWVEGNKSVYEMGSPIKSGSVTNFL
jgi:hypothetical protein